MGKINIVILIENNVDIDILLESINYQTFTNFNLTIINLSEHKLICQQLSTKYHEIDIFNTTNLVSGLKEILKLNKGDYIKIIKDESILSTKGLELEYQLIKQQESDLVVSVCKVVPNLDINLINKIPQYDRYDDQLFQAFDNPNCFYFNGFNDKLFKKTFLLSILENTDQGYSFLITKALYKASKISFLNMTTSYYRENDKSLVDKKQIIDNFFYDIKEGYNLINQLEPPKKEIFSEFIMSIEAMDLYKILTTTLNSLESSKKIDVLNKVINYMVFLRNNHINNLYNFEKKSITFVIEDLMSNYKQFSLDEVNTIKEILIEKKEIINEVLDVDNELHNLIIDFMNKNDHQLLTKIDDLLLSQAKVRDRNMKKRIIKTSIARKLFKLIDFIIPQKNNLILMASLTREDISGNMEFVYNNLKKDPNIKIELFLRDAKKRKITKSEVFKLYYYFSRAKTIIIDDYFSLIYPHDFKKSTNIIQLWHACGAFKRVGFSRKDYGNQATSRKHKNYTHAIVSSDAIITDYAQSFGISEDKVYSTGIPRTDNFFNPQYIKKKTNEILEAFPILDGKKVIMFAPTFRGPGQMSAYYNFVWLDFKKLYDNLCGEYIFALKLHPFVKDIPEIPKEYQDFFVDLSGYREINDLLFITDILITDYSSVIFEYSLLKKKIIFYTPDLDHYTRDRGFYYDFDDYSYGPVVKNIDRLIYEIKQPYHYDKKADDFIKKFMDKCDGQSTQRVVELIKKTL